MNTKGYSIFIQHPERPRGNAWFQDLRWRLSRMQGMAQYVCSDQFAQEAGIRDSKATFGAIVVSACGVGIVIGLFVAMVWK